MRRILIIAVGLAIATGCAAQATEDAPGHITVLSSSDAHQHPDRARISSALNQIVSYLHVDPLQLPDLVVIYTPRQTANLGVLSEKAKVTVAKINFQDAAMYQVWITGLASDDNTIQGLLWALNRHYGLKLGEERMNEVRSRVSQQMRALVSANALRGGQ